MLRPQTACAMKGPHFQRNTFSTKCTQFPSASSGSSVGTSLANGMRRPFTASALRTSIPALSHANLEILNSNANTALRPHTAKLRTSAPSLSRASLARSASSLLPAAQKNAQKGEGATSPTAVVPPALMKKCSAEMECDEKSRARLPLEERSAVMQPDRVESPSKSGLAVSTAVNRGSMTVHGTRRPTTANALRTSASQPHLDPTSGSRPHTAKQRKAVPSRDCLALYVLPATQVKPCANTNAATSTTAVVSKSPPIALDSGAKSAVAPSAATSPTLVVRKLALEGKAPVTRSDSVVHSPAKSEAKTANGVANTAAPSVLTRPGESAAVESGEKAGAQHVPPADSAHKSAPVIAASKSEPCESSVKSALSRQKSSNVTLQRMSNPGSRVAELADLRIDGSGIDEDKRKLSRPKSAPTFHLRQRLERQSYMLPNGERKNSPQLWGSGPPRAGATRLRWDNRFDAKSGVFDVSKSPATLFKKIFERGDLPCQLKHAGATTQIDWKVGFDHLDLDHYLPLFIDGIRERSFPCSFLSLQGSFEIIRGANPTSLALTVRKLILPLKDALNTREPGTVVKALRIIKELLICVPLAGERLVPYYRQLLPVVAIFRTKRRNLGDAMDFAQTKQDGRTLDSQIEEVLQLLEENGGEDAFINIKYMIPTYESCRLMDG